MGCLCNYNVITMKTSIIKIGNSKGVRIPKALLEISGIDGEVELSLRNGSIIISPVGSGVKYNEEYLMSLEALKDWNDPREDEAWASLQ